MFPSQSDWFNLSQKERLGEFLSACFLQLGQTRCWLLLPGVRRADALIVYYVGGMMADTLWKLISTVLRSIKAIMGGRLNSCG